MRRRFAVESWPLFSLAPSCLRDGMAEALMAAVVFAFAGGYVACRAGP